MKHTFNYVDTISYSRTIMNQVNQDAMQIYEGHIFNPALPKFPKFEASTTKEADYREI